MFASGYRCFRCGKKYPLEPMLYKCWCGGSLDIQYDYGKIRKELKKRKKEFQSQNPSHLTCRKGSPCPLGLGGICDL